MRDNANETDEQTMQDKTSDGCQESTSRASSNRPLDLEDIIPGLCLTGIVPGSAVMVTAVEKVGVDVINITLKCQDGTIRSQLVTRQMMCGIGTEIPKPPCNYDGDGDLFKLLLEARRIRLAYLFDSHFAVSLSRVDPLPHQLIAVYQDMLPRHRLRFILADDPGAGKTIMAGLLIKELILRENVQRCLICAPGNLVEQWQDELNEKFHMFFPILDSKQIRTISSENDRAIVRLDQASRDRDLAEILDRPDDSLTWDLVVCDEAHKMAASMSGSEIKKTLRYELGERLGRRTRHLLLLTATPHNGKEDEFKLFISLLDKDRFGRRILNDSRAVETGGLMRRLIKEDLCTFEGTPLFPERYPYTAAYKLSEPERRLYESVTAYVSCEMNRAERISGGRRGNLVGFAMTILQRRLASSPAAIYHSLGRRREKLQDSLRAIKTSHTKENWMTESDNWLEDLEDRPAGEVEFKEEEYAYQATTSQTAEELQKEIDTITNLEAQAREVLQGGTDRKWEELRSLLEDKKMFDDTGKRRKLIIFTEHRDTLDYLSRRIRSALKSDAAVVIIHGGISVDERKRIMNIFTERSDEAQILVATDAAGEGVNLQRANLVINYDLPWNPNRIEQRFGRVHRIGQTQTCYFWNLVADETREGEVYHRLLTKLETERKALGGRVFDVLGRLFQERKLKDLLIDALLHGGSRAERERILREVDITASRDMILRLLDEKFLARDCLDPSTLFSVCHEYQRAVASRIQPHFLRPFFIEAFSRLDGTLMERESNRFEVRHMPNSIRNRENAFSRRRDIQPNQKHQRICFEKGLIRLPGKIGADFICPGNPLFEATVDLLMNRYDTVLEQGAILVDPRDEGSQPRMIIIGEHSIIDGNTDRNGNAHLASRRMSLVEVLPDGTVRELKVPKYLDYRPLSEDEKGHAEPLDWNSIEAMVSKAKEYILGNVLKCHLDEVKLERSGDIARIRTAVSESLSEEIDNWGKIFEFYKAPENSGKAEAPLFIENARLRKEEFEHRLRKRMSQLDADLQLRAEMPRIVGHAVVIPAGMLRAVSGRRRSNPLSGGTDALHEIAMNAVMETERALGRTPRIMATRDSCYDIESVSRDNKGIRFIMVRAFSAKDKTIVLTRTQMTAGLNLGENHVIAMVEVDGEAARVPRYVHPPLHDTLPFNEVGVEFRISDLLRESFQPN